jgi:asparagine synthetase B (glutamine-hydrolysing)
MCGILGAYPPCETSLAYLAHRGPDTAGILKMPQIVLGHTRLAIRCHLQGNARLLDESTERERRWRSLGMVFH